MQGLNLEIEKGLLLKAKEDKKNFGELYQHFLSDVYRFSYSILNNQHDAEDITSQTFIEFYKKLDSFEWQGITMKSWLFTTARNLSLKKFSKPKTEMLDENYHTDDEHEISFVDEIINLELVEQVKEEIQKLSSVEQEIINLRIWEGMSYPQIAGIQNSTEEATRKRFNRSIDKIRKALESKGIKALLALPILFTAIKQVGSSPAYAASPSLSSTSIESLISGKTIMDQTTNQGIAGFLTSKLGIAAIVGVTAILAVGGGIVYTNLKPSPSINNPLSNVTSPTPTVTVQSTTSPSTPTITLTTTPTKIPITPTTPAQNSEKITNLKTLYLNKNNAHGKAYYEFSVNCFESAEQCKHYLIDEKENKNIALLNFIVTRTLVSLSGDVTKVKSDPNVTYFELTNNITLKLLATYEGEKNYSSEIYDSYKTCSDISPDCLYVLVRKPKTPDYKSRKLNDYVGITLQGNIGDINDLPDEGTKHYIELLRNYSIISE